MQESGVALMGTGLASGENRAIQAIDAAMASPLLSDNDIHGARGILLNITSGNEEIRMDEVTQITEYVQEAAANETEIIWGVCYDDNLEDEIAVTLIATGFEGNKLKSEEKVPMQRIVHKLNEEVNTNSFISKTEVATDNDTTTCNSNQVDVKTEDEVQESTSSSIMFLREDNSAVENNSKEVGVVDPEEYGNDFEFQQKEAESSTNESKEMIDFSCSMSMFSNESQDEDQVNEEQKPISKPNMAEIQRERMMKLKNIVSINKIKNNQSLRDMENEPAYIRKNVEFSKQQKSNESNLSKYNLEDNYDGKPEIKENNSFLHDNVD